MSTSYVIKTMANIVVSRFSADTLVCNKVFREKNGLGCVYGTPLTMKKFEMNEVVFVIEMNITENRVEGIGVVLNIVKTGTQYNIYENYNYNRYVYCGKYRLDRTDLETLTAKRLSPKEGEIQEEEDSRISVLQVLDQALFRGKSHMKRGSHMSKITDRLINKFDTTCNKLQEAIIQSFVEKFGINIVMDEEINYELYGL
jgi:hypothetical protein